MGILLLRMMGTTDIGNGSTTIFYPSPYPFAITSWPMPTPDAFPFLYTCWHHDGTTLTASYLLSYENLIAELFASSLFPPSPSGHSIVQIWSCGSAVWKFFKGSFAQSSEILTADFWIPEIICIFCTYVHLSKNSFRFFKGSVILPQVISSSPNP